MIVRMRDKIEPLCDRHFSAMELAGFEARNIQLTFRAYVCREPGCSRAYNSTLGYHDINMSTGVTFAEQVRRQCPDDQTFMFVSKLNEDSGEQTWTCAQVHCDHSEVVQPDLRKRVATLLKRAYPDWMSLVQISDSLGVEIGPYSRILGPMEADGEIVCHGEPESGIVRWRMETFEIVTDSASISDPRA